MICIWLTYKLSIYGGVENNNLKTSGISLLD